MLEVSLRSLAGSRTSPARSLMLAVAMVLPFVLAACTTADVLTPVPQDQVGNAAIDPFKDIRFWADEPAAAYAAVEEKRVAKVRAAYGDTLRNKVVPLNYLCISGGGSNGAYGAGSGRLDHKGTRPHNGVTGISTG